MKRDRSAVSMSIKNGHSKRDSMARDVSDGHRGVDGRFAKEVQTELGFLAVPFEQSPVGALGSA